VCRNFNLNCLKDKRIFLSSECKNNVVCRNFNLNCLKDKRILLSSAKPDYVQVWSAILDLCGCKVSTKFAPSASKSEYTIRHNTLIEVGLL
jgi:hypothetical protein